MLSLGPLRRRTDAHAAGSTSQAFSRVSLGPKRVTASLQKQSEIRKRDYLGYGMMQAVLPKQAFNSCLCVPVAVSQDANNMMSTCFLRWHRFAQSAHIAKAHAELQSSDNLVNFLSSTLLGEMRPWDFFDTWSVCTNQGDS